MCRGTAGTGSGGVQDAGGGGADRAGVPQHVDPLAGSSPAPPPRPGDAVMEQHRPRGQNIPSCSRDNVSLLKHALAAQRHFFLLPLDATAGEIKGDGAPGGTRGGGCAKTTPGRFGSQSPAPPLRPQGKCRGRVGCCGGGSAPSPRAPETPRCEPHPLHCPPRGGGAQRHVPAAEEGGTHRWALPLWDGDEVPAGGTAFRRLLGSVGRSSCRGVEGKRSCCDF